MAIEFRTVRVGGTGSGRSRLSDKRKEGSFDGRRPRKPARPLGALHGHGGFEKAARLHGRPGLRATMLLSQKIEALAIVAIALIWIWVLLIPQRRK
jgi:hypothetical protein